jgi:tetratricopeptide (TPR) repeat protein
MAGGGDQNHSLALEDVFADNQTSAIQDLVQNTMSIIDNLADFPKYGTTREQLQYLVENVPENDLKLESAKGGKKDNLMARKCLEANEVNRALRLAEQGTRVMVAAFTRRGEVALASEKHADALEDFECALENCEEDEEEEDDDTRFKIYHKIAQTHAKMKQFSKAVEALEESIRRLEITKTVATNVKAQFSKQLRQSMTKLKTKEDVGATESLAVGVDSLLKSTRKDIHNVSTLVEMRESERQGRYSVAGKNIPCGTVISVEKPITSLLNPDNPAAMFVYCVNCLCQCRATVVPCNSCSAVVFCSRKCRDNAAKAHDLECAINLYARRQTDTSDSFRIFMSLKILFQMDRDELMSGDMSKSSGFSRLFGMVTHHTEKTGDTRKKDLALIFILFEQLKSTGYFGELALDTDTKLKVMDIIHNLLQIQDCNTHPILTVVEERGNQVGLVKIGNCILVSISSHFNHSCCPNTCRINNGDKTVLIATRNIKVGEEISDTYSSHYSEMPVEQRKEWLSENFYFDCACKACAEKWPTYETMEGKVNDEQLLAELQDTEDQIRMALSMGSLEAALMLHIEDVEMVEKRLKEPHRIYASLRNSMQFCMWRKYGRMKY